MREKKPYFTFYYISYLCLALAMLCFFRYCVHRGYVELVFFVAFLFAYFILFRVCGRALQCDDGYSLLQAVAFSRACDRAGYKGGNRKKEVAVLTRIAKKFDDLETLDLQALKACYLAGKQADKLVTNPAIRFLWTLRDKTVK